MFFRAIEHHDTAVKACSDKSRIKVLQNHQCAANPDDSGQAVNELT
jgi:hypothetical protein